MHVYITVALPGSIPERLVHAGVHGALDPYSEYPGGGPVVSTYDQAVLNWRSQHYRLHTEGLLEDPAVLRWSDRSVFRSASAGRELGPNNEIMGDYNPAGIFEGWVYGGRDADAWTVRPTLRTRVSRLVHRQPRPAAPEGATRRNCVARLRDIVAASLEPTTAYIAFDGVWRDCGRLDWFTAVQEGDPDALGWPEEYARWICTLAPDTWLARVDAHR